MWVILLNWIHACLADSELMYHHERFALRREHVTGEQGEEYPTVTFTIPIHEPLPAQLYLRAISDRWLGAEATVAVSFQHLMLPSVGVPHTPLLNLQPLPLGKAMRPLWATLLARIGVIHGDSESGAFIYRKRG